MDDKILLIIVLASALALFLALRNLYNKRPREYKFSGFRMDNPVSLVIRTDWNITLEENSRVFDSNEAEMGIVVFVGQIRGYMTINFDYEVGLVEPSKGVRIVNNDLGSFKYFLYLSNDGLVLEEVTF